MAKNRRQIPAPESLAEMLFPLSGVDVSTEFELQPPQTTPVGKNVRGFEQATGRQRGGSRPGLSKYVAATVNGVHVIQHLNYIVDPGGNVNIPGFNFGDGLYTSSDPLDGGGSGGFTDTSTNNNAGGLGVRNPGRAIRSGGSGIALNRHRFTPPPTPITGAWMYVQYANPGFVFPASSCQLFLNGTQIDTLSLPQNSAFKRFYVDNTGLESVVLAFLASSFGLPAPDSIVTYSPSIVLAAGSNVLSATFQFGGADNATADAVAGYSVFSGGVWQPPAASFSGGINGAAVLTF